MSIDPEMKFTRVWRGYDPREVDAVFEEFMQQIEEQKKEICKLNDIARQYDEKIALLIETTKKMELERLKDRRRMSATSNTAAETAAPYETFLKEMEQEGHEPKYPRHKREHILEHFGD